MVLVLVNTVDGLILMFPSWQKYGMMNPIIIGNDILVV